MLILKWGMAPEPKKDTMLSDDGMVTDTRVIDGQRETYNRPGHVLGAWARIREIVGTVPKEMKKGMKFATLSSENVIDRVREAANSEGILIFPVATAGKAYPIDDGTLCDVNVTFRVQSIEDGSFITIAGFGEGADSQDKAGGKAGTYAMKAALVQALLAGGSKAKGGVKADDTDDTDEPIPGGVKRTGKPKAMAKEAVAALFDLAADRTEYAAALTQAKLLDPAIQLEIRPSIAAANARIPKETT